eukprot:gnl/Hemi2/25023_TR8411_c0_g1_i1.p1 gnl/Hemi2/25023_TR8411_c0_g1~~gnl/Hemi2/25023_TR8411_c0_g1_i1.p1  ORF type:complete len:278 (+),score=99.42 gnl/Hemi2/25023_TR8411_c0_g1_i1:78-911(+)
MGACASDLPPEAPLSEQDFHDIGAAVSLATPDEHATNYHNLVEVTNYKPLDKKTFSENINRLLNVQDNGLLDLVASMSTAGLVAQVQEQHTAEQLIGIVGPAPYRKLMADTLWLFYCHEDDGHCSAKDFLITTALLHHATVEEKNNKTFNTYDRDGDGLIEKGEYLYIMSKMMEMTNKLIALSTESQLKGQGLPGNALKKVQEAASKILRKSPQLYIDCVWAYFGNPKGLTRENMAQLMDPQSQTAKDVQARFVPLMSKLAGDMMATVMQAVMEACK